MLTNWADSICQLRERGEAYVLATVISVQGSAPRDSGSKFVVTHAGAYDTIGGGHLEYQCIDLARNLLRENRAVQHIEHFPLGARLGQCCGGVVSVLFEIFSAPSMKLVLFGAGHVGRALATILGELPMRVTWVDSRVTEFPDHIGSNIERLLSDSPADEVQDMPSESSYLVMTHDHQLDMAICETVLKRGDFNYLGLIASQSKAARFRLRLARKGIAPDLLTRLRSPVGLDTVPGKRPMEVAVSIAGELIAMANQCDEKKPVADSAGLALCEIKELIARQA